MNRETELFESKTTIKKVLIIANLFHASPRIPGLAKYLHEFGWEPIILTTPLGINPSQRFGPPDDIKEYVQIIEVENPKPVKYPKGMYFILKEFMSYPDEEKHWFHPALEKAKEIIENNNIDAIISSSSPVTCHLIAKELKDKYHIPWIADLRDLWSQNHNYPYCSIRKNLDEKLERETLGAAEALVTVSSFETTKLNSLFKNKLIYTIHNGFDPINLNVPPESLTSNFTITYTGNIYKGKQQPSKILDVLRDVIDDGLINPDDIEVRFYGPYNKNVEKKIKRLNMSDYVIQYGIVERNVSFKKQKESQLLLLFNWEDSHETIYPLKLYEYLAAQRPIIATGGFEDDKLKELLSKTSAGKHCAKPEQIKDYILKSYREYKNTSRVEFRGNILEINGYSYLQMAKQFGFLLDKFALESKLSR